MDGVGQSVARSGGVENAAALLAADQLAAALRPDRRRRRHFHVATRANPVLDCNHRGVAFAREQALIPVPDIFIDAPRELFALRLQLFQTCLERFALLLQVSQLSVDGIARSGRRFFHR